MYFLNYISHAEYRQNLKLPQNIMTDMPTSYVEGVGMNFIYLLLFHLLLFALHTVLVEQQKVKKLIMYWGKENTLLQRSGPSFNHAAVDSEVMDVRVDVCKGCNSQYGFRTLVPVKLNHFKCHLQ